MSNSSVHTIQMRGWVQRMRAGDPSARDEMLRAVFTRLEQLGGKLLRRFPNVQRFVDADDVVNSATLRLLRSLEKLEPDSMRAFYGLASEEIRRELLDLARRFYGPRGIGANVVAGRGGDDSGNAFDPVDSSDNQDELDMWVQLHEEVAKLPTEEREVVGLVVYHGWTQKEIAELFQVAERTVRRWWQSALLKLRTALGESGRTALP
jgi:RNA polymerase sigma-70 factor (ECF subfamily)